MVSPTITLLPLALPLAVGLAAALLAVALGGRGRAWWGAAILLVATAVAARLFGHSAIGSTLGAASELSALALVAATGTPEARAAARTWALALIPAIAAVAAGSALIRLGHIRPTAPWDTIAVGLLVLGFALKLALVPLYFWLPNVARAVPAVSLVLIVGIVDADVFSELATLSQVAPWIFADHVGLWTALAALSILGGALLALAETDLKAILAFTGTADAGLLLLGLVSADPLVLSGIGLGVIGHALAKTALFGAVACGEASLGQSLSITTTRGLAGRLPVASAVFMVGAGALVGLPPSLGFSAHWRLFRAAEVVGGPVMTTLVFVAVGILLLVMVRTLHRVWLGPSDTEDHAPAAPVVARAVLIAVALAIVASGLVPRVFEARSEVPPHALALVEGTAP